MTIGRATYQPGWKWSEDVGAALGERFCQVEHVGMVICGCATAAMDGGDVIEMRRRRHFLHPAQATTAGWSATSPMSRSISSAPNIMPTRRRRGVKLGPIALLVRDYDEAIDWYTPRARLSPGQRRRPGRRQALGGDRGRRRRGAAAGQGQEAGRTGSGRQPAWRPGRLLPRGRGFRRGLSSAGRRRRRIRRSAARRALRQGGRLPRPLRQPLGPDRTGKE